MPAAGLSFNLRSKLKQSLIVGLRPTISLSYKGPEGPYNSNLALVLWG